MKKYVILPDVTCDLSKEIREKIGLENYIPGHVHINDKSLITALDWENISRDEFYKTLSNKKNTVSSAPASPEEYYMAFKKFAEQGYDILSMSLSSVISTTYNIAKSAAERINKEYPEVRVYCFDSARMSGSLGLLVMYACELRSEGKSFDEVIAWLEENKCRVHQMGPIDDLMFIARRGRISGGKAIMGTLVGVKPMGDCNDTGYVSVLAKVKGMKKAIDATVKYAVKMAKDIESQYLLIAHSDREQYALTLKEKLENSVKCRGVLISDVFSASGTNIGPGMLCLNFMGEPISENNVAEKEALAAAISELS